MTGTDDILTVSEERLTVGKRERVTGRVRIETKTETIDETLVASLMSEAVEVRHVPVGRVVEAAPAIRTEGDVTIIPVLEEVLVVEKRLVLREELHLVRTSTSETHEIPVRRRKQRAVISRLPVKED